MEKVWFVLEQTHYPAPDLATLGSSDETSPVVLGHLVPSLKQLDFPINRNNVIAFPRNMPLWATTAVDLSFTTSQNSANRFSLSTTVPTPAGISAGGSVELAFKNRVKDAWQFERLETVIVQPNLEYVKQALKQNDIQAWVQKEKLAGSWSIFMITGLMIAKAANFQKTAGGGWSIGGGPKITLPTILEADLEARFSHNHGASVSGKIASDFIWALRLAKISQTPLGSILRRDWTIETLTKGATFDDEVEEVDIQTVLRGEGLTGSVVTDDEAGMAVVFTEEG